MRRRALVTTILTLLIATILGGAARSGDKYQAGDMPNPTGRANAEPGMAVDGQGRIWATSLFADVLPQPPDSIRIATPGSGLWMSDNGGESYKWMGDPLQVTPDGPVQWSFSGGDSDVAAAVEENGHGEFNVYVTGLHLGENSIAFSEDGGRTWVRNPLGGLAGPVDRPWIAADGKCTAYLAYATPGAWWLNRYDFCVPPSAGMTKEPVSGVQVTPDGGRHVTNSRAGKLIVDTWAESPYQHRLYLPLETCTGSVDQLIEGFFEPEDGSGGGCPNVPSVVVAYSSDRGLTWETSKVAEVENRSMPIWPTTMASDAEGNVYIAWHDNHNSFISSSEDGGETWSEPVQVNEPGTTAVYPTVAAGVGDDIVVAWYGTDRAGDANDPEVMAPPEGEGVPAQWGLYVGRAHKYGKKFKIEIVDPLVHLGVLCTRGSGCPNQNITRGLLDNFGVVMLEDGRAAIAYTSDQPGGTRRDAYTKYATQF